ncbi:hypothetical protein E2320_000683, partial [Naja naja]
AQLSIHPSNWPSIHPSAQLAIQPATQLFIHPSICPASQPAVHLSSQLPSCPSVQPAAQLSIHSSIQLAIHPTIHPSIYSSVHPSSRPAGHPASHPAPASCSSSQPASQPSSCTSSCPSIHPSVHPAIRPAVQPASQLDSFRPSVSPTVRPSVRPSVQPSLQPAGQSNYRSSRQAATAVEALLTWQDEENNQPKKNHTRTHAHTPKQGSSPRPLRGSSCALPDPSLSNRFRWFTTSLPRPSYPGLAIRLRCSESPRERKRAGGRATAPPDGPGGLRLSRLPCPALSDSPRKPFPAPSPCLSCFVSDPAPKRRRKPSRRSSMAQFGPWGCWLFLAMALSATLRFGQAGFPTIRLIDQEGPILEGNNVTLECLISYEDNWLHSWISLDKSHNLRCWFYDIAVNYGNGRLLLTISDIQSWHAGPYRYLHKVFVSNSNSWCGTVGDSISGDDWILPSGSLTLYKVTQEQAGTYTCQAQHPTLPQLTKSKSIRLLVETPKRSFSFESVLSLSTPMLALAVALPAVLLLLLILVFAFLIPRHRAAALKKMALEESGQRTPIYKGSLDSVPSVVGDTQPLVM